MSHLARQCCRHLARCLDLGSAKNAQGCLLVCWRLRPSGRPGSNLWRRGLQDMLRLAFWFCCCGPLAWSCLRGSGPVSHLARQCCPHQWIRGLQEMLRVAFWFAGVFVGLAGLHGRNLWRRGPLTWCCLRGSWLVRTDAAGLGL